MSENLDKPTILTIEDTESMSYEEMKISMETTEKEVIKKFLRSNHKEKLYVKFSKKVFCGKNFCEKNNDRI